MIRIYTPNEEYVCDVDNQGQAERVIERYIRHKREIGEKYDYNINDFIQEGIQEEIPLENQVISRYEVLICYTRMKRDGTRKVERYYNAFDTLEKALKKARGIAKQDKLLYMTTLLDTYTGEIIYQKIENNESIGGY